MSESDTSRRIRLAAFRWVSELRRVNPTLRGLVLEKGFSFQGEQIKLLHRPRGIFKPTQMEHLLSLKTVYPERGRQRWYADQHHAHRQFFESEETVEYSFMGNNPNSAPNGWLRRAFEEKIPVIYFLATSPGRYEAMIPTYINNWNRETLTVSLAFGHPLERGFQLSDSIDSVVPEYPEDESTRRYALQTLQRRLHQSQFREAVIHAYGGRCAVSRIPEPLLLDAAHIAPDRNELLGQPVVQNGVPLSKIHHAAFDANLIGIDPDYRLHVANRLLDQRDGPLLETLKRLRGEKIHLPRNEMDWPDRERLELRFSEYRSSL